MVNNKVCIVIGAVDAICASASKEMAKNGYATAIVDSDIDTAKRIADEICTFGGLAKAYEGSASNKNSLASVRSQISAELGKCNVIVNCIDPNSDENVNKILTFAEAFIRDMEGEVGCSIVNVCPMGCMLEAETVALTRKMAYKMADGGIRVNGILYGAMISRGNRDELYNEDNTPTEAAEKVLGSIPMGRFGKPEEIAGALKYLTDPIAASYTTGTVICIDGGMSAGVSEGASK